MLKELIIQVSSRINNYIPDYPIISQDIDKNEIYPCFKINVINSNVVLKNRNIVEYNYNLAVNFYPQTNIDNRILLLEISEKLNQLFAFEFDGWYTINKEVINNEDFITCLLDYQSTKIFENELELLDVDNRLINEKEIEIIENIKIKEE